MKVFKVVTDDETPYGERESYFTADDDSMNLVHQYADRWCSQSNYKRKIKSISEHLTIEFHIKKNEDK